MTKSDVLLSVRGVVNRFGAQVVHDGVSFDVMQGEIVGLIGGSGAGKSVLLKTMIGLRAPNEGEVLIGGRNVLSIAPAEKAALFGVLFQGGALFSSLTVSQNIALALKEHTKLPKDTRATLAQLKIALTGLPPEAGAKYPSELSGGMIKRAGLARALAMDPLILFLDEPTAGLDPASASAFDQLILDLNRSLGVTVVMVTHDLDSLFVICDRVAALVNKKVTIDTLSNLSNVENDWLQEYLHGPRAQGARFAAQHTEGAHGEQ
jgi:phospholipid/cholesterol/gamma-HCH transport system ATP-binding protein